MTRLVITEPAALDIEAIGQDLALKAGNATASRYLGQIQKVCDRFVRFPSSGAPCSKYGKGTRMGYVRPYVIFYRYDIANDVIFVVRVLHSKRNITRALFRARRRAGRNE
jgi:toxin ParE1/3/4